MSTPVEPIVVENPHTCVECNQAIQEGQRSTQAACEHFFHTDCYTRVLVHLQPVARRCRQCNQHIVEGAGLEDFGDEPYGVQREIQFVRQAWRNNREFRKEVKDYAKTLRLLNKQVRAVKKVISTKKAAINDQWNLLKNQMQTLYDATKAEVIATDDYKRYRSLNAKISRMQRVITERYHMTGMWTLRRALHGEPGFRRLPEFYFRMRPNYIIIRGFRFRIKP